MHRWTIFYTGNPSSRVYVYPCAPVPEEYFEAFIGRYLTACSKSAMPMDIRSIRTCVAIALINTKILMNAQKITH